MLLEARLEQAFSERRQQVAPSLHRRKAQTPAPAALARYMPA